MTTTHARAGALARRLAAWSAQPPLPVAVGLMALVVLVAGGVELWPGLVAPSAFVLVLLVGGFVLRWRALVALAVLVVVLTGVLALSTDVVDVGQGTVVLLACAAVLVFGLDRQRIGLQGAPGALMLVDLRDRLTAGGRLPVLPGVWEAGAEVRSAHGAAFSGDFVVAHRRGDLFETVLVDVSGKGQAAGVRALQLQGALSGLLGALTPEQFLPAANTYLVGQDWGEGFATAVHLALDLTTGRYRIASAGHLPPAVLHAGSGRIDLVDASGGVALGVLDDMTPGSATGVLGRGDALVLYTDGLVEAPHRDVDQGIDRLLGVVEAVVAARSGSAHEVLAGVRAAEDDDRAVVVLRRRA